MRLDCDAKTWKISNDLYFEFGSAELSAPARERLHMCAPRVAHHLRRRGSVRVDGFTDGVGTDHYNWGLSRDRATSVAQALGWSGPADVRFAIRGHGEGLAKGEGPDPALRVVVVTLR